MLRWPILVLLAACGNKADPGGSAGSAGSARGSAGTISKSSPIEGDPAYAVVERAFRGQRPAFPLLSKDGNVAAVEIVTPIGQSGGSTYSVAFITAGADAWSGADAEPVTLVDAKLVHLLLDSGDTAAVAKFDIDSITKAARGISDRILEGGFRRLDSSFDAIGIGDLVAAGSFRFKVTEEATSAITIVISEGTQQVASEQIQPVPMGRVGDVDCVAMPVVKRAFSDAGRRRLLLHGVERGPGPVRRTRRQVPADRGALAISTGCKSFHGAELDGVDHAFKTPCSVASPSPLSPPRSPSRRSPSPPRPRSRARST